MQEELFFLQLAGLQQGYEMFLLRLCAIDVLAYVLQNERGIHVLKVVICIMTGKRVWQINDDH